VKELTLFTPPAQLPEPLTERQTEALDHLKTAGREGLTSDQLGELIGAPPLHRRSTGHNLLRTLKKKRHATERRGGVFVAVDAPAGDDFGEIPF